MATIAISQCNRLVRFGDAFESLDFYRLFKDGKRYRRLVDGFQQVSGITMFLDVPVFIDFPSSKTPL
jgi:hypothetical protein